MTTLSIDVSPELMERAKSMAAAQNTTVEQIVEDSLIHFAGQEMSQAEIVTALEAWSTAHPFRVDLSSFTRDEINQR